VDEATTGPSCALAAGVCSGSRQVCTGGSFAACAGTASYGTSYQATETTCDGLDNDCDGTTDEGCACVVGTTQACGSAVGACERGMQTCGATGWGACTGGVDPVAEECNGLDDDCNGSTDDGLTRPTCALTAGVCAGRLQQCGGGAGWLACTAADYGPSYVADEAGATNEAVCDGLDNDCDGTVDEGCSSGPLVAASYDLFWPAIYDQLVAFVANPDGNDDVFVYDQRTGLTTRLTTTAVNESSADVYGDVVVYQRGVDAAARVVAYDLSTGTETVLTSARSERPRVSGAIVVWQDARSGTSWDVYAHDLTDGMEYALLSGAANEAEPDLRGANLVYSTDASGSFRIHVRDLTTAADFPQSTTSTRGQGGGVMDWAVFAWSDARATVDPLTGTSNWDVYAALVSAVGADVPIATVAGSQILGGVDGGVYVWSDRRAGNWDVIVRPHGGAELILTSSTAAQADPRISGDLVVWEDNRLGTFDIYASRLVGFDAAAAGEVAINEILYDPPTGADVNGDGTANASQDEFVELVNTTAVALDISGYTLSDAVGVRHTFATGTVIPAAGAIVVFGGGAPAGVFGGVRVAPASTSMLGLNNTGGDTVTLATATGTVIDSHAYTAAGSDQSLVREPEYTGAFVSHTAAADSGGAAYSPGTRTYGYGF
jgi:beta propeller repeat protein